MDWPHFITAFAQQQQLPNEYLQQAQKQFDPVVNQLENYINQMQCVDRDKTTPLFIGLNGCQGSGKTTLAAYLALVMEHRGLTCLNLSIDDFYLSKASRESLANHVHPLFAVRGVPGTHDTDLLKETLEKLRHKMTGFSIPRFDKAQDDLLPKSDWALVDLGYDLVIVEGWFWGAKHQKNDLLRYPINALEEIEDPEGVWRGHANRSLKENYEGLYRYFDAWLMLKAPSFNNVYAWRLEQEQKLKNKVAQMGGLDHAAGIMTPAQIRRFVQYYERITTTILEEMPKWADVVWSMDDQRQITKQTNRLIVQG